MDEAMKNQLENARQRLVDGRAFLSAYLTASDEETKAAQEVRLKDVLAAADEVGEILTKLLEAPEAAEEVVEAIPAAEEDINLEYKTHTLGTPDGADNIEGDWAVDGETAELPEESLPEELAEEMVEEEPPRKKEKKAKKGKKGKKGKKAKKGKK